eukprot:69238_1
MITLYKHDISVNINDRYAITQYLFNFENTNTVSDELQFELTIDPKAFISKFEAVIDGELFVGKTKEREEASSEYAEAKEKDENAILISQPHRNIANVFQIKTNIDAKSKISLTITLEQYLQKTFDFNQLNIQILRSFNNNITQTFNHISFAFNIEDSSGIYDVDIAIMNSHDVIIDHKTINKQKCVINGKILSTSSINELLLKYKIKGEEIGSYLLFDNKSNTFCHIFSNIITDSIVDNTDDIN